MVKANPLVGVGPTRVGARYREFLDPNEPGHVIPHLHNVPMQIAAERGLPALAAWLGMLVMLAIDMVRRLKFPTRVSSPHRPSAAWWRCSRPAWPNTTSATPNS